MKKIFINNGPEAVSIVRCQKTGEKINLVLEFRGTKIKVYVSVRSCSFEDGSISIFKKVNLKIEESEHPEILLEGSILEGSYNGIDKKGTFSL